MKIYVIFLLLIGCSQPSTSFRTYNLKEITPTFTEESQTILVGNTPYTMVTLNKGKERYCKSGLGSSSVNIPLTYCVALFKEANQ